MEHINADTMELEERVVYINRVSKVVKGGRRFSLTALVVVGDGNGHVGVGYGKAKEVPEAIRKGAEDARKNLVKIALDGTTIPYQVTGISGAGRVFMKPAAPGTGVIAGGPVRAVVELAGIKDILTKCLGTANQLNVVKATMAGLLSIREPAQIAKLRGIDLDKIKPRRNQNG